MKKLILLALLAPILACSKGAHVIEYDEVHLARTNVTKYRCDYSSSILLTDRTVAICDTQAECNQVCAALPK